MEILLLLGLILFNGLFAMSEIALIAARKSRLQQQANAGDSSAKTALRLGAEPTRFLSTIQIGITSISILNGIVGQAVLAEPLAVWLHGLGLSRATAELCATAGVVMVVTYVSIVVGELVPKRLGLLHPESIARHVARPMLVLALLARPFVLLLTVSTHAVLRVLMVKPHAPPTITEEEIRALLDEGSQTGVIEQQQHDMLRNVFRLDDRQLGSLMIPRAEVVFLDTQLPVAENLQRMLHSEHSCFPVCDGNLEKVQGFVHAKQILARLVQGESVDFADLAHAGLFVPETLTGMELLAQFRASNMQMAFVIDEYGEIQGLVTLQDVLEAVTGELPPHNLEEAWAVQREDGSWLLDGAIPLPELKDQLALTAAPEEENGRYHTLSGMLMLLLGRVPATGDHCNWQQWRLEVVDMDGPRIDKVLASRIPTEKQTPPPSPPGTA